MNLWLENRLELFKAYCLPSIIAQSCQDFDWLIYFDAETPANFIEKIERIVSIRNNIEICTVKTWGVPTYVVGAKATTSEKTEVLSDIIERIPAEVEWVLTTRLNPDDALHKDFVKNLHGSIVAPTEEVLNFPNGIILGDDRTYLYNHTSNAFISLFEPVAAIRTVLCAPHLYLNEVAPVRQLSPAPAFLQVVHGANDLNKVRGFRAPKILALQGFEAIGNFNELMVVESIYALLLNNVVFGLFWHVRDYIAKQYWKLRRMRAKGAARVGKS